MNKFIKIDDKTVAIKYSLFGKDILCLFDAEDLDLIKQYSLRLCSRGYVQCRKKGEKGVFSMIHNIIMQPPAGMEVDHIHGHRADNRKSQLRLLTHKQNTQNRHKQGGCSGVYLDKKINRYYVQIKVNGKNKHIGMREKYEDAVNLRNKAVEEYYGLKQN